MEKFHHCPTLGGRLTFTNAKALLIMKEMNGDVGYVEDVGDDWADIRFQAVTTFNEFAEAKKTSP